MLVFKHHSGGQSLPCQRRWWASYCCYEPLPTQWWGGNIFWKTQCTTLLQKIIQFIGQMGYMCRHKHEMNFEKTHPTSLSQGQYWLPDLLRWDIQTLLRNLLENLQCMQLFSVANEDVRPTQRRVTIYSSPICSLTIRWHLAQDTLCYLCATFFVLWKQNPVHLLRRGQR